MNQSRWSIVAMSLVMVSGLGGCRTGPGSFKAVADRSSVFRARAIGLGEHLPNSQVIPSCIERLHDPHPRVRLAASQELTRRTGKTFGYQPWADPPERAESIAQWRAWWNAWQSGLATKRRKG